MRRHASASVARANLSDSELEEYHDITARIRSFGHANSYERPSLEEGEALMKRIADFCAEHHISKDVLSSRPDWPEHEEAHLSACVRGLRKLVDALAVAENLVTSTVHSSSSERWTLDMVRHTLSSEAVILDPSLIERNIQALANSYKEMVERCQDFSPREIDTRSVREKAKRVATALVFVFLKKAEQSYSSVFEAATLKYDRSAKAVRAYQMLSLGLSLRKRVMEERLYEDEDSDAQRQQFIHSMEELKRQFPEDLKINLRSGQWDVKEEVKLRPSSSSVPKSPSSSSTSASEDRKQRTSVVDSDTIVELQQLAKQPSLTADEKALFSSCLSALSEDSPTLLALSRLIAQSKNTEALHALVALIVSSVPKTRTADWERLTEVLHACAGVNWIDAVEHLLSQGWDISSRQRDGGHTPLHTACSKGFLPLCALLLRSGANPLLRCALNRTALQHLQIKFFPAPALPKGPEGAKASGESDPMSLDCAPPTALAGLASFMNSPLFSDVTFRLDSGEAFHGHRIIFASQSPVFKAMLDAKGKWQESEEKEVLVSHMQGATMNLLMRYLYTGSASFVRDDIHTGVALMSAANHYMLPALRNMCEVRLCSSINTHNVVDLYKVGVSCSAPLLCTAARVFLLQHYERVSDADHEALLFLFENTDVNAIKMETSTTKYYRSS